MITFDDVVEKVRLQLRSYTGQHEVSTYTTGDITAADLLIPVNNSSVVTTGLVEVGDELVWVEDTASTNLVIPPYGRGYSVSTAATHLSGTQVVVDPLFPREAIREAIADTQRAMYPTLFAPMTVEFTYSAGQTTYELPVDADRVISVSWELSGDTGFWAPVRRWRADLNASTTAYPNGNSLTLLDGVQPARTVRVVYAAPFVPMALPTDEIGLIGGHQESHSELLVLGAGFRLVQFLETARLNMTAVENQERSKYVQPGAASSLARQLLALYERRLEEERARLLQLYPIQIRYTR